MIDPSDYPIDRAGDAVPFAGALFGGSHRKPRFLGRRRIATAITRDSDGAAKRQHTFSIRVLASDRFQPIAPGTTTARKGRNLYRNGTHRKAWASQSDRAGVLAEKHHRRRDARDARNLRKNAHDFL